MKLRQLIFGALLTIATHPLYATDDIDYYSTSAWLCYAAEGAEVAVKSNRAIGSAERQEDNKVSRRTKNCEWQLNLSPQMVVAAPFDKPRIRQTETVSI